MKKKLLISFLLSLMLVPTVSSTAVMADDETKVTTLTYTISESYAWTIHPAIDFGKNAGAGKTITKDSNTVSVTKCILEDGNLLQISAVGSGTDGTFTINNGSSEILGYTVKTGDTAVTTGGVVLTVESGEDVSSTDMTFTLATSKTNEVAGTYSGTVIYSAEVIKKPTDYAGYYADIDGDGTVDGVIFADLAFSKSGQWGGNQSPWSYTAQTGLKDYYISQESYAGSFGTKAVISPVSGTSGNDRFYVMALSDIDGEQNGTQYDWYNANQYNSSCYAYLVYEFGFGKSNTSNVMTVWKDKTSEQDTCPDHKDIWGQIQTQVNNGWFVPSLYEWAAFGSAFNITSSNYSSFGLSTYYWSSSSLPVGYGGYVDFDKSNLYNSKVDYNIGYLRLATTF